LKSLPRLVDSREFALSRGTPQRKVTGNRENAALSALSGSSLCEATWWLIVGH
jgi:hypothetical protein